MHGTSTDCRIGRRWHRTSWPQPLTTPRGAPDVTQILTKDAEATSEIHQAAQVPWQQQVLETLLTIWRWRHNVQDGEQQWAQEQARLYLEGMLRAAILGRSRHIPLNKRFETYSLGIWGKADP
jgi:hypothetical protein